MIYVVNNGEGATSGDRRYFWTDGQNTAWRSTLAAAFFYESREAAFADVQDFHLGSDCRVEEIGPTGKSWRQEAVITDVRKVAPGDYVETLEGERLQVSETWGIKDGRLAKPSEGGFGVVCATGKRVGMMEAKRYLKREEVEEGA